MPRFLAFAGFGLGVLSDFAMAQSPWAKPDHDVPLITTRQEVPAMPPATTQRDLTDTCHGVVVHDPHRWLEDAAAPALRPCIAAQNAHTGKVMGNFGEAQALAQRVGQLAVTSTPQSDPHIVAGSLSCMRQTPPQAQAVLVAASWPGGAPKGLVDPNATQVSVAAAWEGLDDIARSPDQLVALNSPLQPRTVAAYGKTH